jgi:hypothetical protein
LSLAHSNSNLKKVLADRPEGYDSELTRKCQELEDQKQLVAALTDTIEKLGYTVQVTIS